jgi:hypothetical protein
VANVRLHGTTRERPRDRFDREERFLQQRWRRVDTRRWSSTDRRLRSRVVSPVRSSRSKSARWRPTRS